MPRAVKVSFGSSRKTGKAYWDGSPSGYTSGIRLPLMSNAVVVVFETEKNKIKYVS